MEPSGPHYSTMFESIDRALEKHIICNRVHRFWTREKKKGGERSCDILITGIIQHTVGISCPCNDKEVLAYWIHLNHYLTDFNHKHRLLLYILSIRRQRASLLKYVMGKVSAAYWPGWHVKKRRQINKLTRFRIALFAVTVGPCGNIVWLIGACTYEDGN